MTTPFFDTDKTLHLLTYVSSKLGKVDFHRLFKILYFADEKHLALYGFPIVGDEYIAMKNGLLDIKGLLAGKTAPRVGHVLVL